MPNETSRDMTVEEAWSALLSRYNIVQEVEQNGIDTGEKRFYSWLRLNVCGSNYMLFCSDWRCLLALSDGYKM